MQGGIDTIDVYKMKFGETFLFNKYDTFINEIGLPKTARVVKDTFLIDNKDVLDSIVSKNHEVILQYDGYKIGFLHPDRVTIDEIDFRKTDKSIQYNNIIFDSRFTFNEFKKLFPQSASILLDPAMSLFRLVTNESQDGLKHYMVLRKSIDDPDAEPTLEFTFENGKLIHIFFANF